MSRFAFGFYGDNVSDPNTAYTFGPYVVGVTVSKLTYVKVNMSFGEASASFAPGSSFLAGYAWGVQWVPHGNSPLVLPADYGSAGWLWSQSIAVDGGSIAAWTPATDSAEILASASVEDQWRGQQFVGEEIDFYVNYGAFLSASLPEVIASFTLQAACTY